MRTEVATDIRAIFNAPDRAEADHLLAKFLDRYENGINCDTAGALSRMSPVLLPKNGPPEGGLIR
jgi:hypothetical protein